MNLVVVESPAKAKTINKYLGAGYTVLASFGHVRDLASKDGSVRPDEQFAMTWEIGSDSKKHIADIVRAAKSADALFLATDPDREGEAISWHVLDILRSKKGLAKLPVKRVVFNEITKSAVLSAMANPRDLDQPLIDAYLARRALDYLVGFTLSPVLWRKLPGARSAGRVQSVALRLICDRENEIEIFKPREYWTIEAALKNPAGQALAARLTHLEGQKLDKYTLADEAAAMGAKELVEGGDFSVASVDKKPLSRNPQPPFTTATLQQEAARKLGFSASRTMRIAQHLYEGVTLSGGTTGLITYMRTDGVQIAQEAMIAARQTVEEDFGRNYLPAKARIWRTKAKNAQEAHEAIRPTDPRRRPGAVREVLDDDHFRLYELVWKRTIASQMENARLERTTIEIADAKGASRLRASGSVLKFDGFLKLYQEGHDDNGDENSEGRLPATAAGEPMQTTAIKAGQHFTEPLPRFTEASLVKKMEELSIGRPSTYASILDVLRARNYVRMDRKRFVPEDKGRLVTGFLTSFFERYVEYSFTADLEDQLDQIAAGKISWKEVLRRFWSAFSATVEATSELRMTQVIDALNDLLAPHLFGRPPEAADSDESARACPQCDDGRLSLKLGRFGAFIGCSNYPECRYTRQLGSTGGDGEKAADGGPRVLGTDPQSGLEVTVRDGRFGPYVQLGEPVEKEKPKRASLPKGSDPASITLEKALALLALPRAVGDHPETGKPITANIGRYGPYVAHDGKFASLPTPDEVFTVGVNRAVSLLADAAAGRRGSKSETLRELGNHPDDGAPIQVLKGRYGPYVKHGKINATLPKGSDPQTIGLDEAVSLIAAKAAKKPAAKGRRRRSG